MLGRNEVKIKNVRFTALSPTLVRFEYDEKAMFEDKPSIRAITRPQAIKFDEVVQNGDRTVLSIGKIKIFYQNDGFPFSAGNLSVKFEHQGKEKEWNPETQDNANLGGTFLSMDSVDRHLIPQNVHSANIRDIDENALAALYSAKEKYYSYSELPFNFPDRTWILDIDERWKEIPKDITQLIEKRRKYPAGILSRNGYFLLNDSHTPLFDTKEKWWKERPDRQIQDWYFFAYGNDYSRALKDFIILCGKIPMLPKGAFGIWFSVYKKMGEKENRQIVNRFRKKKLPLDVLVIDLYWHLCEWSGFDWNKKLYPKPEKFIEWLHKKGIRVTLNVHPGELSKKDSHFSMLCKKLNIKKLPEPNVNGNYRICNLATKKDAEIIMDELHLPVQRQGLDFWWIDGTSVWAKNLPGKWWENMLWTNHVYFTYLEKKSKKRALILSRYGGLGSHRYPVCFSADTFSQWEVLHSEINYTARAGNVGLVYWSHDIGGFQNEDDFWHPRIDPELFVRWTQFGCFSPIVRLHSSFGIREPWKYEKRVLEAIREVFQIRMSLIPYIYHFSYIAHKTGIPLCRPMYIHYPDDRNSYDYSYQYFFGENIIVAPVDTPGGEKKIYLPQGKWYIWEGKEIINGPRKVIKIFSYKQIPLFVKAGSIIPRQEFSYSVKEAVLDSLILDVYTGENTKLKFYEDDGESLAYKEGKFSFTEFKLQEEEKKIYLHIGKTVGSYEGMPKKRKYKINIYSVDCPKKVMIDGNTLPYSKKLYQIGWSYNKSDRRIQIVTGNKTTSSFHKVKTIF